LKGQYGSYGIDFIPVPGGRAERKMDGSYRYEYDLTDHLGNVRVTIQENPATHLADALQKDDYYPFGLRSSLAAGNNHYPYNGKEVQEEINQYDYGARFYDRAIGRWNGVDRLAEQYSGLSIHSAIFSILFVLT
jgi:RHS repeat-associated protein